MSKHILIVLAIAGFLAAPQSEAGRGGPAKKTSASERTKTKAKAKANKRHQPSTKNKATDRTSRLRSIIKSKARHQRKDSQRYRATPKAAERMTLKDPNTRTLQSALGKDQALLLKSYNNGTFHLVLDKQGFAVVTTTRPDANLAVDREPLNGAKASGLKIRPNELRYLVDSAVRRAAAGTEKTFMVVD